MNEEEICVYILKGIREPILHAISLHDNSTLKKLKENLKKYELMQFRINSRSSGISEFTAILNKQVMQLNNETKDSNQEIKRLYTKIEGVDSYHKNKIDQLCTKIDQLCTEMHNFKKYDKTVNFENRSHTRDRSPYPGRADHEGRNNYREKSPYPDRYNNDKFRGSSRDRYNNNKYRNNSREISNNRDRSDSRNRENSYDRSRDRNSYNNRSRENDKNRKQHSRENSRERYSRSTTPEGFNGREKITCYKCNGKGHYANDCNFSKKRIAPELREKSEYLTRGINSINTKTNTSKSNKEKQMEKNNYIHFVENWYKSTNSSKLITNEINNDDEISIENIVTISSLNPLNEFQKFLLSNNDRTDFRCDYNEQTVNIFSLPNNIAIGHCTSQCLTMSKGIALQFRNKFNNVQNLIDQEKKLTEIAYLKNGRQWILYLITKNKYYDKPAYTNIFSTLTNTRQFCIKNNITTLALPKICTGQDKKDWNVISTMIKFIFQDTQIKILICLLPSKDNEKQNKYFKNNDYQTTNITIGKNFNNTIGDNLKNEIALIAGSFIKTKDVHGDGDCGAHALRICLKQHGIYRKTVELLNMLGIPNCKSGYYFKDDDLAFICDQFNLNLYLIHEDSEHTNAIIYWKLNRKNIGIFKKNCNWTPGIITKVYKPHQFNNIIINTVFPDFNTVEKNVDHFLHECFDRLKLSQQNPIEKNKTDNNFKNDESTIWYSQFCQDCEHLSTTKDILDDHDDKEQYWSEGGNVMFCEICGNYVREYRNRPIQEDEKAIDTKNQLIQLKDEIKINNQDTSVDSDTDRKQRVLSIKVKLDGNEQNAIIDTGSNLSCIDYSLVKNKQEIKPKEQIKLTGADNNELIQKGTTEVTITINKLKYQIKVYVIEGLSCKLLLGNDFNIKYNIIVNFKNKNIQIENNSIKMDEIWYGHNANHNISIFTTGSTVCKNQNNETIINKNEIKDDQDTI